MGRRALISRSHRWLRLAHTLAARQPLAVRIARRQRLARALGLTGPTAETPALVIRLPGLDFEQVQQLALSLPGLTFRPAFVEQAKSGYEAPSVPIEAEEISKQQAASLNPVVEDADQEPFSVAQPPEPHITERVESGDSEPEAALKRPESTHQPDTIAQPIAAQSDQEQKRADSSAPPVESVKARRPRGRIQEQPVGADEAQPAPLPPRKARSDVQEVPDGAHVHKGETGQQVTPADNLFAPRGTDRSPQAWMVRLMGAKSAVKNDMAFPGEEPAKEQAEILTHGGESEQTTSQPRAATSGRLARDDMQAQADPVPLSQRARRFLQPLVGIDLENIRVYRDTTAGRLTEAYQADALTIGERVEMAEGHQDDTPETLGLLAHEFTHVARQREPRFIPPAARSRSSQASAMSEEALARVVEGQVKRAAQEQVDRTEPLSPEPPGITAELSAGTTPSVVARPQHDSWGGLPAPWEPLPDWLAVSPAAVESGWQDTAMVGQPLLVDRGTGGGVSRAGQMYGGALDTLPGSLSDTLGVQRAGQERSAGEDESPTTEASSQLPRPTAETPEPDLDDLARQVYSLLKRRLGVEYRRES